MNHLVLPCCILTVRIQHNMIVPTADIKMSYQQPSSSRCCCQIFIISQETVVIASCDPQSDNATPLSKLICALVHRECQ